MVLSARYGCSVLGQIAQKFAALHFQSAYSGVRPDTKWPTSLNPGVDECPGVTSESMNASSSAVIFTCSAPV